jgi:hypothetical protein
MTTAHATKCTGDIGLSQRIGAGDLRHAKDIAIRRFEVFMPDSVEKPDWAWDKNVGGYRFTKNRGSREVSPRLSAKEAYQWIGGFLAGMDEVFEALQEEGKWQR